VCSRRSSSRARVATPPDSESASPSLPAKHGWKKVPGGWLVESHRPLTSDQIANAREIAAHTGLTIEVRREQTSFAKTMAIATAAVALLALAILEMSVGRIRGESASPSHPDRDRRHLSHPPRADGHDRRRARPLGALLGVAGAYVLLAATYHDDLGYLSHVPFLYLALAVVGVSLAATAAGWLLAGREPPAVARPVIE
jgi:putative ABC transport system permease protein